MSTDETTVDQLRELVQDHPELAPAFQPMPGARLRADDIVRWTVRHGELSERQRQALASLLSQLEAWSDAPPGVTEVACERIHAAYRGLLRTVPTTGGEALEVHGE